jgi:hypothetical protein
MKYVAKVEDTGFGESSSGLLQLDNKENLVLQK